MKVAGPKGAGLSFMGRIDPVEHGKRAKYQPPAMRVRDVCYTKKSPFRYNRGVQATMKERKGDFNGEESQFTCTHKMDVQISYRLHT